MIKYHISFGNDCSPNSYVKSHVDNVHIMYDRNYVNDNNRNDGGNCDVCSLFPKIDQICFLLLNTKIDILCI